MYFWKVDKLVEDFKSNNVSQKEELKYAIFSTILVSIAVDPLLCIGISYNIYDLLNSILMLAASLWGVWYCYMLNSKGDNKDFILRVVCIGVPAVIKILVIFIPLFVLAFALEDFFISEITLSESNEDVYEETTIVQVVTMVGFIFSYYVYLGKKIKAVSS